MAAGHGRVAWQAGRAEGCCHGGGQRELIAYGCVELAATDASRLRGEAIVDDQINRDLIGKDAHVLARAAGVDVPEDTKLLIF